MKTFSFLFILTIGLFFTACNQNVDPTVSQETLDTITKLQTDTWAKFHEDHDMRAMIDALYTEDAKFMPPNGPVVKGKDGIEKVLNSFPPFNIEFNIVNAEGSGDLVILTPMYKMSSTDGAPMDEGKSIEVWKKQKDGTWKIDYDIFNSNLPHPEPELAQDHAEGEGDE